MVWLLFLALASKTGQRKEKVECRLSTVGESKANVAGFSKVETGQLKNRHALKHCGFCMTPFCDFLRKYVKPLSLQRLFLPSEDCILRDLPQIMRFLLFETFARRKNMIYLFCIFGQKEEKQMMTFLKILFCILLCSPLAYGAAYLFTKIVDEATKKSQE